MQKEMSVEKSIFRKIRKILARAEGNANSNEAATAAKLAIELMERYRLTRAMVEAEGRAVELEVVGEEEIARFQKQRPGWAGALAQAVAEPNSCKIYWNFNALQVVGRETDRRAVRMLFEYLYQEIDRLTAVALRRRATAVHGRTFSNNFRLGAVGVLRERLKERAKASAFRVEDEEEIVPVVDTEEVRERALVLLSRDRKEVDVYYRNLSQKLGLRPGKASYSAYSREGRDAGERAGRRIPLGPQLSSGKE